MPKLPTTKRSIDDPDNADIGYNLRRSQKVRHFPHESSSLIFVGISRRRADVAAVRQQLRQRRNQRRQRAPMLLLPLRKRPVSSPGANVADETMSTPQLPAAAAEMRPMMTTTASSHPATTTATTTVAINDAVLAASDAAGNEEVQFLFCNLSADMDLTECTPRSGQMSPGRSLVDAGDNGDENYNNNGDGDSVQVSGAMTTASSESWTERLAAVDDGLDHTVVVEGFSGDGVTVPVNAWPLVNASETLIRGYDEFEQFLNDIRLSRA